MLSNMNYNSKDHNLIMCIMNKFKEIISARSLSQYFIYNSIQWDVLVLEAIEYKVLLFISYIHRNFL